MRRRSLRWRPLAIASVSAVAALATAMFLYANFWRAQVHIRIQSSTMAIENPSGRPFPDYGVVAYNRSDNDRTEAFFAFGDLGAGLKEHHSYLVETVPSLPNWLVWMRRATSAGGYESPKEIRRISKVIQEMDW